MSSPHSRLVDKQESSMTQIHTEYYYVMTHALARLNGLIKDGHTAYIIESEDRKPHRVMWQSNEGGRACR